MAMQALNCSRSAIRRYHSSAQRLKQVKSSLSKGSEIPGLNIMKNQEPVRALDDSEYPSWLWTLLDEPSGKELLEKSNSKSYDLRELKDGALTHKELHQMNLNSIKEHNAKLLMK